MGRITPWTGTTAFILLLARPVAAQNHTSPGSDPPDCDEWKAGDLRSFFEYATAEDTGFCLEAGGDVDARDDRNRTPLHWASLYAADADVLAVLLTTGADVHARDWGHITSLHEAASRNANPAIVTALVEAGADVNTRDARDRTPLHAAWWNPNPAVIHTLLELGADRLARNDWGAIADPAHCEYWNTPNFARVADTLAVKGCLESGADPSDQREADPSSVGELGGNTPLHHAVQHGDVANVALLLNAGVEVDVRNGGGQTPLHLAASNEDPAVAALLLEAGADVHARETLSEERYSSTGVAPKHNRTPLHYAASNCSWVPTGWHGTIAARSPIRRFCEYWNTRDFARFADTAVVRRCMDSGADVRARDDVGNTPLHHAVQHDNPANAALVLDAGVEVDIRNDRGKTPLHLAVSNEDPGMAALLLGAGADVNARDRLLEDRYGTGRAPAHDRTPLHYAASNPNPAVGAMLLNAGAAVDPRDGDARTPLHRAAGNKNAAIAISLFAASADVNAHDVEGVTPLLVLARTGRTYYSDLDDQVFRNRPLVEALLDAGADVNVVDEGTGLTTLHYAILVGREDTETALWLVRRLLQTGADPNPGQSPNETPLYVAAAVGDGTLAATVLEARADVHAVDARGRTALHVAVELPERAGAIGALLGAGANVNSRDSSGETPLFAATSGRIDWMNARVVNPLLPLPVQHPPENPAVAALVRAGTDLEARGPVGGTALHWAASNGNAHHVAVLLAAGAPMDARNERGDTPLHAAASARNDAVVTALVAAGADIDAQNDTGETPLHLATNSYRPSVIDRLPELGADPEVQDDRGRAAGSPVYPWRYASFFAAAPLESVRDCLEMGEDANASDDGGNTPLHFAAASESYVAPAIIKVLAGAGADVNALNHNGETPLHRALATRSERSDNVATLLESGADANVRDERGWTLLHVAAWRNRTTSFPLLV